MGKRTKTTTANRKPTMTATNVTQTNVTQTNVTQTKPKKTKKTKKTNKTNKTRSPKQTQRFICAMKACGFGGYLTKSCPHRSSHIAFVCRVCTAVCPTARMKT